MSDQCWICGICTTASLNQSSLIFMIFQSQTSATMPQNDMTGWSLSLPLNSSTGPAGLQLLLLACWNIPASVATDLWFELADRNNRCGLDLIKRKRICYLTSFRDLRLEQIQFDTISFAFIRHAIGQLVRYLERHRPVGFSPIWGRLDALVAAFPVPDGQFAPTRC